MMTKFSSTSLTLSALAGLSTASYFYYRHKSQQPRQSLKDLQGNFYACGSDVCRLYRSAGLVVVITGTSSGLGAQTAKLLGKSGAFVIMGNRRPEDPSTVELVQEIERDGGKALAFPLDLASFASVKKFANQVQQTLLGHDKKLDIIIHNAGAAYLDGTTQDGYQRVWQVNSLAPALLTELLVPSLRPDIGRVIFISSEMHRFCFGRSVVEKCPPSKTGGKSALDYALSKACQILQAQELNHRSESSIRGFAIEPGLVRTQIGRHAPRFLLELEYVLLGPFFLRTLDQGCASTLLCALAPLTDLDAGNNSSDDPPYYFANCLPKKPKASCANLEEARRLKKLCHDIWKSYL